MEEQTKPTAPIKVLYVNHMPVMCGAVKSLLLLLRNFKEGEVESLVLSPPGPAFAAFEEAGFAVRPISVPSKFASSPGVPLRGLRLLSLLSTLLDRRSGRAIRSAIRWHQPHIVHLNERSLLQAARIATRAGVPVVMHARNVADRETRWAHRICMRALQSNARAVIAIDGSVHHSIREVTHCRTVYNPGAAGDSEGVSATSYAATVGDEKRVGGMDQTDGRTRFLYLSVLRDFKGIWDFLEAARLLKDRDDLEFIVAGGNSRPASFYKRRVSRIAGLLGYAPDVERQVKQFIRRHRLEQSVKLMGHVTDVESLFKDIHVNVFPSWLNGPSRSVFETGLRGIPSILTLRDRVEDIVEDGITGLIVPDRNPKALAEAIAKMADSPESCLQMGQRAKEKYRKQFDPRRSAEQVIRIYQSLMPCRSHDSRF